jgi:hypothetical protein
MSDNQIAIGALTRKRGELAGLIAEAEKRVVELRADLLHIDNALRIMNAPGDPALIPARRPRPRNKGYFVHGELSRRIYDALRTRETVSAAEVAEIALADKGIEDQRQRATFVARFLVRLDQMATKGTVERIGSGNGVRWRLAGEA